MSYFADTASCRRQFQCNFFEIYNKTVGEEDEDDSHDDHLLTMMIVAFIGLVTKAAAVSERAAGHKIQ